jgi:anti-anti-sigma factor
MHAIHNSASPAREGIEEATVGRKDRIEVEAHSAAAWIVTLRGEHDLSTAAELARALEVASPGRDVLVDLTHCTFMDSTAISALLRASNAMHSRGGVLSLVIPKDRHQAVRSVFELMSIERLLPTYETRAAAIDQRTQAPRTRLRSLSEIIDASIVKSDAQRPAA